MTNHYIDYGWEKYRKVEDKMEENNALKFKVFDKYDLSDVSVNDPGLKKVINLEPKIFVHSHGRNAVKFGQTKMNIIERLINRISVAGHRGKKHKLIKGNATGKYSKNTNIVLEAFKLIEKKTQKNPVEVFVRAIENSAPRDETTVIEYGGARYPQAVDVSPLRRVNLVIRWIVQGASDKAFNKKKTFAEAIAEEIILAYENNGESFCLKKKNESEKQADSAR